MANEAAALRVPNSWHHRRSQDSTRFIGRPHSSYFSLPYSLLLTIFMLQLPALEAAFSLFDLFRLGSGSHAAHKIIDKGKQTNRWMWWRKTKPPTHSTLPYNQDLLENESASLLTLPILRVRSKPSWWNIRTTNWTQRGIAHQFESPTSLFVSRTLWRWVVRRWNGASICYRSDGVWLDSHTAVISFFEARHGRSWLCMTWRLKSNDSPSALFSRVGYLRIQFWATKRQACNVDRSDRQCLLVRLNWSRQLRRLSTELQVLDNFLMRCLLRTNVHKFVGKPVNLSKKQQQEVLNLVQISKDKRPKACIPILLVCLDPVIKPFAVIKRVTQWIHADFSK